MALLVALAAAGAAAECPTGTTPFSSVPYSVEATTTGDADSTTFVFTVCSSECAASDALCKPLTGFSIGADAAATLEPAGAAGGCGVAFSGDALGALGGPPAEGEACEAFYATLPETGARVKDLCGGECRYAFELEGGAVATTGTTVQPASTAGGSSSSGGSSSGGASSGGSGSGGKAPKPYGPTPYGQRRLSAAGGFAARQPARLF